MRFARPVTRRHGARAVAAVLGAGLVAALALPAAAVATPTPVAASKDSRDNGTWFFDEFGVKGIHDEGVRGKGVTVAVLDTAINTDTPDLRDADVEPRTKHICDNGYDGRDTSEEASHGTGMTSIIVGTNTGTAGKPGIPGVAPEAKVLHYAVLTEPQAVGCDVTITNAIRDAVDNGAKIISMSLGWGDLDDLAEGVLIAQKAGAIVDIAVQNEDGTELDSTSIANGVVAIENTDPDGQSDGREVVNEKLTVVAPGINIRSPQPKKGDWDNYDLSVGTSPATAWVSGVLALAWSKWPKATGNQLIQSMIRNTSNGWKELEHTKEEGFGLVSPWNLVVMDPRDYPDENPLIRDDADAYPTWSQLRGDAKPTDWKFVLAEHPRGSSVPVDHATKQPVPFFAKPAGIAAIAGLMGGLLLLVGVLVIVLVARKRRQHRPAFGGAGAGFAPAGPGFGGGFGGPGGPGGPGVPFGAPAPAFGQAPVFGQAPAFGQAPVFGQASAPGPGPVYGQQAPAFGQQAPVFGQASAPSPSSVYGQPSPGFAQTPPQYGQRQVPAAPFTQAPAGPPPYTQGSVPGTAPYQAPSFGQGSAPGVASPPAPGGDGQRGVSDAAGSREPLPATTPIPLGGFGAPPPSRPELPQVTERPRDGVAGSPWNGPSQQGGPY